MSKSFRSGTTAAGIIVLIIGGCTSAYDVPLNTSGPRPDLGPGEQVEIETRDGRQLNFKVERVDPDALIGPSERVPYEQIATLKVVRLDENKTGAAFAGTIFGIPLVVLILASVAFLIAGPALVMGG